MGYKLWTDFVKLRVGGPVSDCCERGNETSHKKETSSLTDCITFRFFRKDSAP
jgi:hypothetical protein